MLNIMRPRWTLAEQALRLLFPVVPRQTLRQVEVSLTFSKHQKYTKLRISNTQSNCNGVCASLFSFSLLKSLEVYQAYQVDTRRAIPPVRRRPPPPHMVYPQLLHRHRRYLYHHPLIAKASHSHSLALLSPIPLFLSRPGRITCCRFRQYTRISNIPHTEQYPTCLSSQRSFNLQRHKLRLKSLVWRLKIEM